MSLPRLRAPTEHGQILAVPPLDQVAALLERNLHNQYAGSHIIARGRAFYDLLALARRETLAASTQYHHEAGETVPEVKSGASWLVAGHQPELFHPGVWFKNFALHHLAQRHQAVSLNLIIDTDAAKPAIVHFPAGGIVARAAFDRSTAEVPYEERIVQEESTFADFPRRMKPIMAKWNFEPMLPMFWQEVMRQAQRTPLLGERCAAARRAMERRFGVVQREVPMSRVCQTRAFAWFACWVLTELAKFHRVYNQTVQDYRSAHGIRGRSRPVPDLGSDGEWLEAPFWAWRHGQTRRGRLFVRHRSDAWSLKVQGQEWPSIPTGAEPMAEVEAWQALETQGFKIRSRALTTTMFARLFLADLFIHGIGGGIYDELTSRIIERFFNFHAADYLVLSATLHLPLPRFPDAMARERELQRRWRDLRYKPERFVPVGPATEPLIRAKQEWIARVAATHRQRVERFERIRTLNGELLPGAVPEMERVRIALKECRRQKEADAIAGRRDYAFCLYPEEMLRTFFADG